MTDSKTIEDSQPHLNVDDYGEGVAITKMFNIYDPWEDLWIFVKSYISASDYNKKKSMNCKWIGCTNDQFFWVYTSVKKKYSAILEGRHYCPPTHPRLLSFAAYMKEYSYSLCREKRK